MPRRRNSRRGSGTLYQRGGIYYLDYSVGGQQIRVSTRSRDRQIAQGLLIERLAEALATGRAPVRAERLTVRDLLTRYETSLEVAGAKEATRQSVHSLRRSHLVFFEPYRALDVTPDLARRFILERRTAAYKDGTIALALGYLHTAYALAVQDGLLRPGHVPHLPRLRVENARQIFIEPATFWPLHAALVGLCADFADAVAFAYLSGWRREEVLGLPWTEISEARRITAAGAVDVTLVRLPPVRSKNRTARELEIAGPLLAIVAKRRRLRRLDCPYVFHRTGHRMDGDRWWAAACAAIGRPDLEFHDMRRSSTRNLRRAGVAEDVIMKISGHLSRAMFTRYNIVDTTDIGDAMRALTTYVQDGARKPAKVAPLRRNGAGHQKKQRR